MPRLGRARPASNYRLVTRSLPVPPGTVQGNVAMSAAAAPPGLPFGDVVTVAGPVCTVTVVAPPGQPVLIPPFPQSRLNLLVELNVGGTWTDITGYVYQRAPVTIKRGRPDETAKATPQTATLTLNNRDGRFTPANPAGAWFGQIGRNTQLRVSAQDALSIPFGFVYRFWGEIPEWPPRWDPTGTDVTAVIQASGVLRRIGQNAPSLRSAMYRYYAGLSGGAVPLAYWPMEDGASAGSLASGLPGGPSMAFTGPAQLAAGSPFTCSAALPQANGAIFTGQTGASGAVVAVSQQVFNSGGSWVAPPGITQILAQAWGAGGGGSATSGGGGGGEYAADVRNVTPGTSYPVTVGTSSVGASGGSSGITADSGTTTAHGGHAGSGATGGAGGTGSTSATHHDGGAGSAGTAPVGDPPVPGSQTFTSSGTFTAPSDLSGSTVSAALWGGGGGGGAGSGSHGGGGGGGGGFVSATISASPSSTHPVAVGAGGTGGTSGTGSTDGGNSTIDGGHSASGGLRGTTASGGSGGAGLTHVGGAGGTSASSTTGGGGGGAGSLGGDGQNGAGGGSGGAGGNGGPGGGGTTGGSGGAGGTSGSKNGKTGSAPGGGGGGGFGTSNAGGSGNRGQVLVSYLSGGGSGTPATGGGGGGSGGTASAGNAGGTQAGAAAVSGGGPGGGTLAGSSWSASPAAGPGGGGGGADAGGSARAGAAGQVILTYAPAGAGSGADANVLRFLLAIPQDGETDGTVVAQLLTTGTVAVLQLSYAAGGMLMLTGLNTAGGQLFTSGAIAAGADGALLLVSMEMVASGGNIAWQLTGLTLNPVSGSVATMTGASGTLLSATVGDAFSAVFSPAGGLAQTVIGHAAVLQESSLLSDLAGPFAAWAGESAAARFTRLTAEQGIPSVVVGTPADTSLVGPQAIAQLAQLLQDCEDADQGLLYEPRDAFGLAYRTRASLYNQAPALALNYTAGDLGSGESVDIEPQYDDQRIRNDIQVSRPAGSSYEAVLAAGAMSVQDPPAGVSPYTYQLTANVAADGQLPGLASWLLHIGTVDENRYPVIPLALTRPEMADNFTDAYTADIGDFLQVQNPPAWLPPGPVNQLIYGFTEVLNAFQWDVALNCVPGSPFAVATAGTARAATSGSLLASGIGTGDATFTVSTPTGSAPWVTTAGNPAAFPFDVLITGEQMTVTGITGAASPQAFTVTRAVNGIARAHSAGEAVTVAAPAIVAL